MKSKCAGGFSTVVFDIDSNSDTSIDYHGRFLKLKSLDSPYLAQYVEFTRLACGLFYFLNSVLFVYLYFPDPYKVALTCEHPKGTPLSLIFSELTTDQKRDIGYHLLAAMDFLHRSGVTVGYLSPQSIIVDKIGKSCVSFALKIKKLLNIETIIFFSLSDSFIMVLFICLGNRHLRIFSIFLH